VPRGSISGRIAEETQVILYDALSPFSGRQTPYRSVIALRTSSPNQ
jgi:hypothetical protein